jgi:glucose-6-phosphate-specific signal transduction histidine kinase
VPERAESEEGRDVTGIDRGVGDGIGGADPEGRGLVGVSDRVAALGRRLRINSPGGGSTIVVVEVPLSA